MARLPTRPFRKAGSSAWLLLGLTMLFWGGGAPVARLAVGEITPMTIVCARWAIALALLAMFAPPVIWREALTLRDRWLFLLLMGFAMTASNSFIFAGAKYTSGINLAILQGVTPAIVLAGAALFYRTPVTGVQILGLLTTMFGVLLVAAKGDPATLLDLEFNRGDIYQLLSCAIYAGYVVALKKRPAVSGLALFSVIAVVSFATSIPLFAIEIALGAYHPPTLKGLAALLYIALFVSMFGHIFFMRAVDMLGPGRASIFQNIAPVIGAGLSVLVLGESLALYHAAALALVIAGIFVCERSAQRRIAREKEQA